MKSPSFPYNFQVDYFEITRKFCNHLQKAFMDDVTVLTENQEMMKKVLKRLDDLITWSRMRFKVKKSQSLTFVKGRQRPVKFVIAGERMPTIKEKPVKS